MTKGFKDPEGQFHPTDKPYIKKKSKPTLESIGIKLKSKTISEKRFKDKVKPLDVKWYHGDVSGVDFYFTKYGSIKFPKGVEHALEQMGARKLTTREGKLLAVNDPKFEFGSEVKKWTFKPDDSEDLKYYITYANSKQNDNTYNYSSILYDTLNFGVFDSGNRTYLSVSEHISGDVRWNYRDPVIFDITDIGSEYGDVKIDIGEFLTPTINFGFSFNDSKYDADYNDYNGFDIPQQFDGDEDESRKLWNEYKDEMSAQMFKWFERNGKDD